MKNLEQIRAAHALKPAENLDRSAINKLPALILTNGLLATAAFCEAESSAEGRIYMKRAMDATAQHLAECGLLATDKATTRKLIDDLSLRDSHHLQRATAEALAFIAYLKRFAPKKD